MICIASSTGVIAELNRAERPATIPSGTPTTSDMPTAANISEKVRTASSQRPSTAKLTNARKVPSAALRPPKRRTISVPSAAVPDHLRK